MGLDDDDDDDATQTQQQQNVQSRQLSDGFNPLLQIFNAVTNVLTKSAARAAQRTGAQLIGLDRNEELKGDVGGVDNDENATEIAYGNYIANDESWIAFDETKQREKLRWSFFLAHFFCFVENPENFALNFIWATKMRSTEFKEGEEGIKQQEKKINENV